MNEDLLYGDLSYKVIGAAMKVHRTLGYGYLEKIYENSLIVELQRNGLFAEQQLPIKVRYEGVVVGDYFADILVERKIILELKSASAISPAHKAQTLNYLKATGLELAIVLNFGPKSLEHHRLINRMK